MDQVICVVCKQRDATVPDERPQFCQVCIDAFRSKLSIRLPSVQPTQSRPTKHYYFVNRGSFVTVVDSRDVEEFGSIHQASVARYQPWYYIGKDPSLCTWSEITRDQYIDWLRNEAVPKKIGT